MKVYRLQYIRPFLVSFGAHSLLTLLLAETVMGLYMYLGPACVNA